MALINFKLRHPDNIIPWDDDTDTTIHWQGLTEGEYWLDLNKATLYEYTPEVLAGGDTDDSTYVVYQLDRLINDWTGIFESIAAPVPDAFYTISRNHHYLYRFYGAAMHWFDRLSADPSIHADTDYEQYDKTIEWIYSRTLTAPYLASDPGISFFRNGDYLSIVWQADHVTPENIPVWTAQNGEVEMAYDLFVHEMEDFAKRFFDAMDVQVRIAVEKDWGATRINKEALVKEQEERKAAFQRKLGILKGPPVKHTDWELINTLVTKMFS